MKDDTGGSAGPGIDTRRFGTGTRARIRAMRAADDLRADGVVAVALFRPWLGGWVMEIHPGRIKYRNSD